MKLSQLSYWCNWQLVSGLEAVMALTTRQGDSRIFKQDVPAPYAACSRSSNPGVSGVKLASPAASYPWWYPSDFFYRSISQINRLVQAISFPEGQVMSPATMELTTANKTDWDDLLWALVSQLGLFFNSSLFQETWEGIIGVLQPFFPPIERGLVKQILISARRDPEEIKLWPLLHLYTLIIHWSRLGFIPLNKRQTRHDWHQRIFIFCANLVTFSLHFIFFFSLQCPWERQAKNQRVITVMPRAIPVGT